MTDPSREWPHYYPDPPRVRCVDDPDLFHEGDEVDGCAGCTPVEPVIVPGMEPVLDTGFDRPAVTHAEREMTRRLRDESLRSNEIPVDDEGPRTDPGRGCW